jgi:hypothetical protein
VSPQESDPKTPVFGVMAVSLGIVLMLILFIQIFVGGGWDYVNRVWEPAKVFKVKFSGDLTFDKDMKGS